METVTAQDAVRGPRASGIFWEAPAVGTAVVRPETQALEILATHSETQAPETLATHPETTSSTIFVRALTGPTGIHLYAIPAIHSVRIS